MAKRKSRRDDDYEYGWGGYFPRSRPIKPADGLQSRSQRGAFAANWWAKRWLNVLEGYGIGSRLQRGRSYGRGGQVLNIEVAPGRVSARVQGSQRTPYQISITIQPLKDDDWERVLDAISQQAIFAAQLLDETMPQEIEQVFEAEVGEVEAPAMTPSPKLDEQMADFWGEAAFEWNAPHIAPPDVNAGVLRRLGPPPEGTAKVLESLYGAMTT
jgi:hypothetical protein